MTIQKIWGLTKKELMNKYGVPYYSDATSVYYEVMNNDYIWLATYSLSATTGKAYASVVFLKDGVEDNVVIDYLGSLYYVFEKGTDASIGQYAFIDQPTLEESSYGIVFNAVDRVLVYQDLKATRSSSAESFPQGGSSIIENTKRIIENNK